MDAGWFLHYVYTYFLSKMEVKVLLHVICLYI